ncbi:peroxidasin homolog [Clytia hemisphaerica]|uniref:peroxidasin homolog n=1 Tax=Clytia hemisphaerica TaxID=252671 RepID=UPI0034D7A337
MKKLILVLCMILPYALCFDAGDTYIDCVKTTKNPASCAAYEDVGKNYRRFDGLCNNLRFPTVGAINTPFRRVILAEYVDRRQVDTPKGFPGTKPSNIPAANKVTITAFTPQFVNAGNAGKLSTLFTTAGQFLDHDMTISNHGKCNIKDCSSDSAFKYPCFPIKFDDDTSKCTPFVRAFAACQLYPAHRRTDRQQVNALTAFVDGSQIYGHNEALARSLRRLDGTGKLKTRSGDLLPLKQLTTPCDLLEGCSLAGDIRADENIALHSMHTTWVREHNRVATKLRQFNYHWNEEKLYQESRKIVIAQWQHVVFNEWVPRIVDLGSYGGYNSGLDPRIINAFAAAAFRFGHSLAPNAWSQLDNNFDKKFQKISLRESFFNIQSINQRGIEPTMLGLVGNQSNTVDDVFAFGLLRKLFVPPGEEGHMDLTALNIQRGRDHGLPTYGKWRQFCNLPAIPSFSELAKHMPRGVVQKFSTLYNQPADIDLFAAGISENHVPGFQTGPTFHCLFKHQFRRLRDGDRYFYLNPGVFTPEQRNELKKTSMAKILCNNLKGIVSINKDAFIQTTKKRTACDDIPQPDLSVF